MTILHIDSSINGDESVSRQLSAAIVQHLADAQPGARIMRRDLAAEPIGDLTARVADRAILDEFFAAETIVIGAPMYNFTVPTQLKAWLDRILVAGETFKYDETGPTALAGGRRVIVAVSRGGIYTNSPLSSFEHLESYLRAVFSFIGIEPEFVLAEGVNYGPEARSAAIGQALASIEALAA